MGSKRVPYSQVSRKKEKINYKNKGSNFRNRQPKKDLNPGKSMLQVVADVNDITYGKQIDEVFGESSEVACTVGTTNECCVSGRRIVDIAMWFKQIATLENHSQMGCRFSDFSVISEKLEGFRSGFTVKCKKCQCQSVVWTDDPEKLGGKLDVNLAITLGIRTISGGHSQLRELCRSLNMPCMTSKMYSKNEKIFSNVVYEAANGEVEVSAMEKTCLAVGPGDLKALTSVDANGICMKSSQHAKSDSFSNLELGVPSVAEPVEVFVNVTSAPIESSHIVQEEVDPFEDVEKPMNGDGSIKEDSGNVSEPPRRDDQPLEFVAYSMESDGVILSEDGEEKPTLALESLCCSFENCHRVFDSFEEMNSHHRSCHFSQTGEKQFGSVGDWHSSVQDDINMRSLPESQSTEEHHQGSLVDSQVKLRKWKSVSGDLSSKSTGISLTDKVGLRESESTIENTSDHSMENTNTELSGDSSYQIDTPSDPGAVIKKESSEDVEQDVICVDRQFFCSQCSLMFQEESSLKNHVSEKHLKSNGVNVSGGDGEPIFEANKKMDVSTLDVHALLPTQHVEKISFASDLYKRGSTSRQQHDCAETAPRVIKHSGQRIGSAGCFADPVGGWTAQISGNNVICDQTFVPSLSEGCGVAPSGKSSLRCDICGRLYEGIGDSHLGSERSRTACICEPCVEKFKPPTGGNGRSKSLRRYQCPICGQTYSMKSALKRHERVHTGERPFVCKICSRTFTRNEYLKDHLKSHDLKEEGWSTG